MAREVAVKFDYFGYSVAFNTLAPTTAARRAEANARIIAKFGENPAIRYVEPGLPFPDYVPMQVWDSLSQEFV